MKIAPELKQKKTQEIEKQYQEVGETERQREKRQATVRRSWTTNGDNLVFVLCLGEI